MKLLTTAIMVLLAGMILTSAVAADDTADVKEAVLKLSEAHNAGDVEALSQYIHPQRSLFDYSGRLLSYFPHVEKALFLDF